MWLITTESIYSFTFSEALLSVCSVRIGAVSKWTLGWILFFYLGEETNSTTMSKNNTNTGKTTTQSDMKDGLSIQVCRSISKQVNVQQKPLKLIWKFLGVILTVLFDVKSYQMAGWQFFIKQLIELCFVVQLRMQKQDNFIIINTKLRMWFG